MEFTYDASGRVTGFHQIGSAAEFTGHCAVTDLKWGTHPEYYRRQGDKLVPKSEAEVIKLRSISAWESQQLKNLHAAMHCMHNLTLALLKNDVHEQVYLATIPKEMQERIWVHLRELQTYVKDISNLKYPEELPIFPASDKDITVLCSPNLFSLYDVLY